MRDLNLYKAAGRQAAAWMGAQRVPEEMTRHVRGALLAAMVARGDDKLDADMIDAACRAGVARFVEEEIARFGSETEGGSTPRPGAGDQ